MLIFYIYKGKVSNTLHNADFNFLIHKTVLVYFDRVYAPNTA